MLHAPPTEGLPVQLLAYGAQAAVPGVPYCQGAVELALRAVQQSDEALAVMDGMCLMPVSSDRRGSDCDVRRLDGTVEADLQLHGVSSGGRLLGHVLQARRPVLKRHHPGAREEPSRESPSMPCADINKRC